MFEAGCMIISSHYQKFIFRGREELGKIKSKLQFSKDAYVKATKIFQKGKEKFVEHEERIVALENQMKMMKDDEHELEHETWDKFTLSSMHQEMYDIAKVNASKLCDELQKELSDLNLVRCKFHSTILQY